MSNCLTCLDVENLRRSVASGGNEPAIKTETDTANHALVGQIVDQIHIEHTTRARIEYRKPILSFFFEVIR